MLHCQVNALNQCLNLQSNADTAECIQCIERHMACTNFSLVVPVMED